MKVLPAEATEGSPWDDGSWFEKPGYPVYEGSWIHPSQLGHDVPEFEFEEGNDQVRNDPPPVFYVGGGEDCHIRLTAEWVPAKAACRLCKEGGRWLIEALLPSVAVRLGGEALYVGVKVALRSGDVFSLERLPGKLALRLIIQEEDNWYLNEQTDKDFPNKYPGRFPWRSSLADAPEAPEELKRLAWQTDQMRKRSEEDQVRVSDWASFSQYVKKIYYKHGIECTSWAETGRGRPVDAPPPVRASRALPAWIASVVARERQLPGMSPERLLPFAKCLHASGLEVAPQMDFRGQGPPDCQDLYEVPFVSGPATFGEGSPPGANIPAALSPPPPLAAPSRHSPEPSLPAESVRTDSAADVHKDNPSLNKSFKEWLQGMDESLFLLQYHDRLAADFDSVAQVVSIYFRDRAVSKAFFEDVGIKKLGHRRIFEKWFKENCR